MGSYSDEGYSRPPTRPTSPSPIFRPKPVSPPPPSSPSSTTPRTQRAAQVQPPVTVKMERPQGDINLMLVLDTTGSMGSARENFRRKVQYVKEEIENLLPELVGKMQIAVVGAGDHCDGSLMLQLTPFVGDINVLRGNIASIRDTDGGDMPEAFECFFKKANTWDLAGTNTILLLVTDSVPHGMKDPVLSDDGCPDGVNWETELTELKKKLWDFYVVSCTTSSNIKRLQRKMVADARHLIELNQPAMGSDFRRLANVVQGIVAEKAGKLDEFLARLAEERGAARATVVKTLLKTQGNANTQN